MNPASYMVLRPATISIDGETFDYYGTVTYKAPDYIEFDYAQKGGLRKALRGREHYAGQPHVCKEILVNGLKFKDFFPEFNTFTARHAMCSGSVTLNTNTPIEEFMRL